MSESTTDATGGSTTTTETTETKGFTAPASQADLDRIINERLAREKAKYADYGDLKAKADRLTTLEAANQTEAEKLTARAEAAEKQLAVTQAESLRARVAIAKSIPADLVDRLRGDSEAELLEDADRLLALLQPGKPRGDAAQGPRGDETTLDAAGPAGDFTKFIAGQLSR